MKRAQFISLKIGLSFPDGKTTYYIHILKKKPEK